MTEIRALYSRCEVRKIVTSQLPWRESRGGGGRRWRRGHPAPRTRTRRPPGRLGCREKDPGPVRA